ncbi:MAG: hypothetical protein HYZ49_00020 [Chloroflexi bacterium]|nr:hypothetical protein [Chloroflexota bacterium]
MNTKLDNAWVICEQCDIAHRANVECPLCKLKRILYNAFDMEDMSPEMFNSTLDIIIAQQGKGLNS